MAVNPKLYTVDEFDVIADAHDFRARLLELIHGESIENLPTEEHGVVTGVLMAELGYFFSSIKLDV